MALRILGPTLITEQVNSSASQNHVYSVKPYFLASAFMSQSQEVRVLMRPIWSAMPRFGSGTKTRIRVPAVIPKTGDTYRDKKDL